MAWTLLSPESPLEGLPDGPTRHPSWSIPAGSRRGGAGTPPAPTETGAFSLARSCDDLLLVSTNEIVALHAVQRAQAYLARKGLEPSKIRLIVNRYSNQVGLCREAIQTALSGGGLRDAAQRLRSDPAVR